MPDLCTTLVCGLTCWWVQQEGVNLGFSGKSLVKLGGSAPGRGESLGLLVAGIGHSPKSVGNWT